MSDHYDNDSSHSSSLSSSDNDSVASVHSNDSQLSFEFTLENCSKRVQEFVLVTKADYDTARIFLENKKWNVVNAVNDYFRQLRKSAKRQRLMDKNEEKKVKEGKEEMEVKKDRANNKQDTNNKYVCLLLWIFYLI